MSIILSGSIKIKQFHYVAKNTTTQLVPINPLESNCVKLEIPVNTFFTNNEMLRLSEKAVDLLQAGHNLVHVLLLYRETTLWMVHVLIPVLAAGRLLSCVLFLHRGEGVKNTERQKGHGKCMKWLARLNQLSWAGF